MRERKPVCNPEEIQQTFEENGDFIHRVIRFHIGNCPNADDVFQSFFLLLLEKPVPKKEMVNHRAYLYRMIKNSIIDDVRRIKAYKKCISKYSQNQPYHKFIYDPREKIIREDEVNFIMRIIDRCLPAHIAITLKLRYRKNYSDDRIAQATSVKRKTVIRYISTGLKDLREVYPSG